MKILRIRFENINSLKGLHEIDFSKKPLASSGLFAITGPTGSGKSTILDVITLALFNRIPRISEKISKSVIDKTGLLLTRNMKDCFAEVTYESNAGIYTSKWSIEKARTGNLKDYEMSLADKDNNLLPLRKGDVPEKNEELIGLNFDQFIKAIVLAQGDFASFLKAKGGEREKLLEQVTGSWIYRDLGKAAYSKNKQFGQELERLTIEEQQYRSRMLDDSEYLELIKKLGDCNDEIAKLSLDITNLNAVKKLKEEIKNLASALIGQEQKELEIQDKQKIFFDLNGTKLEKHRKLIPYQRRIWDIQQLVKQIGIDSGNLEVKRQGIENCNMKRASLMTEVETLTGSNDEITKALTDFESKVLAIERLKDANDIVLKGKRADVKVLANQLSIKIDYPDNDTINGIIETSSNENTSIINTLSGVLGEKVSANPGEELEKLKLLLPETHSYKTYKTLLDEKNNILTKEDEYAEKLGQEITKLPDIIENARQQKEFASLAFEILSKDEKIRDLTASLEDHRKRLIEGDPCPLCGSLEHPYAQGLPVFADDLNERMRKAKRESERCNTEFISIQSSYAQKEEELKKIKQKIIALKVESATFTNNCISILKILPEEYQILTPQEMIDKTSSEINQLGKLISAFERKVKLDQLKLEIVGLFELMSESATLAARRYEIYKGQNIQQDKSEYLARHTENETLGKKLLLEVKEIDDRLKTNTKELEQTRKVLLNELKYYDNIDDAVKDIILEKEYSILDASDHKFKQDLLTIGTELNVNKQNLRSLKSKDTPETHEEIEIKLESLITIIKEKNSSRDSFVTTKSVHDEAAEKLIKINEEIKVQRKKNEKWMLLDKYIGDAEGKKFSVFAQQLTLFQLVKLSNKRLNLLNDRYQLDIPVDGEDDSLAVIDRHMGDLRRSVKSLSGGESFLVSLSLALALSDLASRQVEIKSLFIDEGFGSLDKITLDQTIDTLERLQNETNKKIGVISHIEAMQERITTQIVLSRNGQGFSIVDIVG